MTMEILNKSGNFDAKEIFKVLNGSCETLKQNAGSKFDVCGYMLVEKENADGEPTRVLFIKATTGVIFSGSSATARGDFEAMVAAFGEPTDENPIRDVVIVEKPTNKGRTCLRLNIG